MASPANNEKFEFKPFMGHLVSGFLKGLNDRRNRKMTFGEATRRACVVVGGFCAAFAFIRLYDVGAFDYADAVMTCGAMSVGAAVGDPCSYFIQGAIKKYLHPEIRLREELKEDVRFIDEVNLPQKEKQDLIRKTILSLPPPRAPEDDARRKPQDESDGGRQSQGERPATAIYDSRFTIYD